MHHRLKRKNQRKNYAFFFSNNCIQPNARNLIVIQKALKSRKISEDPFFHIHLSNFAPLFPSFSSAGHIHIQYLIESVYEGLNIQINTKHHIMLIKHQVQTHAKIFLPHTQ